MCSLRRSLHHLYRASRGEPAPLAPHRVCDNNARMPLPESATYIRAAHEAVRSMLADSRALAAFREQTVALTPEERLLLVEQAIVLLENFYVHLPFKRAMHAIDPVQRLRLLRQHLSQYDEDTRFHGEMTSIFVSLRDLHTNYLLPAPYADAVAILPFRVEACDQDGTRIYIVAAVATGFEHPTFVPGAKIRYWNGVPIERAVDNAADRHAGSNPDARHARGLAALTQRPLIVLAPPDEEWVIVDYSALDGSEHSMRLDWVVTTLAPEPKSLRATAADADLGIDVETALIQRMRRILFAPEVEATSNRVAAAADPLSAVTGTESTMPKVFTANRVESSHGAFGYIRIWSFLAPSDSESFVNEFVRLAGLLPQNGLIVDVRDNGGGYITASEQLLQVLTPRTIEPEGAQFIDTAATLRVCELHSPSPLDPDFDLSPWLPSLRRAIETGAIFSTSFPLSSAEKCNALGQCYYGPVVLITSARCYSATDMFAAGFQDHDVGPIIGVDGNTGAGGANVWDHALLEQLFSNPKPPNEPLPDSPFKPLPRGAGLRAAIRRTLRVGSQAGTELEDLGVVPSHRHSMTKKDYLNGNVDLIEYAASLLAAMPAYHLAVETAIDATGRLAVRVQYRNVDRLDFFLGGRPQKSKPLSRPSGSVRLKLAYEKNTTLLVQGFSRTKLVASRRMTV